MAQMFIGRPILAWVIAILISLGGILAIPGLPISQYPSIAPPQITVRASYVGASPEEMYEGVAQPIEEELNTIDGIRYFESTSDASGTITITATFAAGTEVASASVDVQNAVSRVEPRLPRSVVQRGITVQQAGSGFLMIVALTSSDGTRDEVDLGDYLTRNVLGELRRIEGVGNAQLFAAGRSLRIWIDPGKLTGLSLTSSDVSNAITAQNAQVAAGSIGADPNPIGQQLTATVLVKGQLTTPDEFRKIVLRANPDGSNVVLGDVARIELGSESYGFSSRLNGEPSAAVGIQLTSSGNALAASSGVRDKMAELSAFFPPGIDYAIPYDTAPFVQKSISKVVMTLVEAVALVFVVMFIFLQNVRYTLIPTLVVPVALLGTLAVMFAVGFSVNVLTMFAMVLAIGILVDDAIVVVENVERIMATEGLPPREATRKAMTQITGAIVGISLVLSAVFIPMAFFPGSSGIIYRQFSLTMVVAILFSSFLALSLTPALCATFLKPIAAGHHETRGPYTPFGLFNRGFEATTRGYTGAVRRLTGRSGLVMVAYLGIVGAMAYGFVGLPSSFLPNEDQGFIIVDLQTPPAASANRTDEAIRKAEQVFAGNEGVENVVAIRGFSFSGSGTNAALMFVTLKDWEERSQSAQEIADWANMQLFGIKDVRAFALSPPPIQGLGNAGGFSFRLQDRGGNGQQALQAATQQLIEEVTATGRVVGARVEGLPVAAQVIVTIDREKANTFGVTFADINATISQNLASSYINDFPNEGRLQRVVVQADETARMSAEDLLDLTVRNMNGGMVPLSSFATVHWQNGPTQVVGYNGYPSNRISGNAAPGYTTGEAMAEIERIAQGLPQGFGYEWTGQSLEEIEAGAQEGLLYGLSIVLVFLLLAGLYESWSIPLSVMLAVPLGVAGSVAAAWIAGLPNDIYFKVGLITIMGLSAKNAILIVEFAKELWEQGKPLREAALEAAKLRFRPILMTSLAFTLGVVPLATATGASSASQNAIGIGVIGGMIAATVFSVFFVPVFFVFVLSLVRRRKAPPAPTAAAPAPGTPPPAAATVPH